MLKYILKRLLLMIPTLIGVTVITFVFLNLAPGGPIEKAIRQMQFGEVGSSGAGSSGSIGGSSNRTDQGISAEVIELLEKKYGFDKPLHIRYGLWLKSIVTFDFGESYSYERPVADVILERMPVSLQFGVISFILTYLICIILGVMKAIYNGSRFDVVSSFVLFVLYSIPPLMLGVLLIVFAAGRWDLFPLGDLYSDNYFELDFWGKVYDRVHHFVLPLICYMITGFTTLTILMKNSLLDEVSSDYVRTARAKGLSEKKIIFKHAFRNSLIPLATGIGSFFGIFFTGSFIIETIFNINGMGLLGYESLLDRDYNVIMALTIITGGLNLFGRLFGDIIYVLIDPRINYS